MQAMSSDVVARRRFLASCGLGVTALACGRESIVHALQTSAASPARQADIDDLVAANRILAKEDVLDAFGHVSLRHPGNAERFLLARSLAPALVVATDIMEYDLDGNPVEARGRTSYRERFIHGEIYRARADVKAVVHCHTASLIPFGVTGVPMRPIYHQSSFVAEGVPVFEIRSAAGMTNMLVESGRVGRALAQTLGRHPAALMRGHGAVIVGDSLPAVVGRSVYLDLNARMQTQAITLGGKITYIDPEEARLYAAPNNYDRAWELWKQQVSR
jgi:HCOMODA/2-hydroxy-3-carboxy-muconic semialdehyde decarboxylase